MRSLFLIPAVLVGCTGSPATDGVGDCSDSDKITLYADNDKDGFGAPGTEKLVCPPLDADGNPSGQIPRGFATNDDDCDDFRAEVNPSGIEICDGIDNDCDSQADEGLRQYSFYKDGDGDSFGDPDINSSVTSCAPTPGFVDNNLDCDDANAGIHPGAVEICDNGIDNDCNGRADDEDATLDITTASSWYHDADGDSYGGADVRVQCQQPGSDWVLNSDDCDDTTANISPSATEVCNRIDDDCDLLIDDSDSDIDPSTQSVWNADVDDDGYGDPDVTTLACFQPWFYTDNGDDCNDLEPLLGLPAPWVLDVDLDGFGSGTPSSDSCTPPAANWVLVAKGLDCDETNLFISPAGDEVCDGVDDDCDGLIDDADPKLDPDFALTFYLDADHDGYGNHDDSVLGCIAPLNYVVDDTDCQDTSAAINPGATEVCDGADNDCDTKIDDLDPSVDLSSAGTWYADFDMDGFGDLTVSLVKCTQPNLYVGNSVDCDDTDPNQLVLGPWTHDLDGDGVGAGTQGATGCSAPDSNPDWVPTYYGTDCDNNDPQRFPGNVEICNDGIDQDCNGSDLPC